MISYLSLATFTSSGRVAAHNFRIAYARVSRLWVARLLPICENPGFCVEPCLPLRQSTNRLVNLFVGNRVEGLWVGTISCK